MRTLRPLVQFRPSQGRVLSSPLRSFRTTAPRAQPQFGSTQPERPVNFYRTHGRAFAKVLTLAFLTYQITYWTWLMLKTEEIRDQKNREIKSLEAEVRLLDEGRKSHKPGG